MDFVNESCIIEAILLLEGIPLNEMELSKISKLDTHVVSKALECLKTCYESEKHGIVLVQTDSGWGFIPKTEFWRFLKARYGRQNSERLSRAAIETLSIIAYSQPITRGEIENMRGVSCESMIRILKEKKLIKNIGKKDAPGQPALLGTTSDFLKLFGLNTIAELPKLDEENEKKFASS